MKSLTITIAFLFAVFVTVFMVSMVNAEPKGLGKGSNTQCPNFVDENGDGINDNCPNGGVRPQDGTGEQKGKTKAKKGPNTQCPNFVDENGDGINDNCPNGGVRPQDGTGIKKRQKVSRNSSNVNAAPSLSVLSLGDKIQDRVRDKDGSCDGKVRKTRTGQN